MSLKKHVGKIKSTDQRCVVVFMQLPDDAEKSLIVSVESLTPRVEQMLIDVVDSQEGQADKDLASTLARRIVPETGRSLLEYLHTHGLMRTESVDNIIMMPRPNTPFPLREILEQMGALPTKDQTVSNTNADVKYNPVVANQAASANEEKLQMARNMLMEADLLMAEANKKREAAYQYAPHLRPEIKKADVEYRVVQEPTRTVTEASKLNPDGTPKRGRGRPSNASKAAAAAAAQASNK